jgi:hypothetical protein
VVSCTAEARDIVYRLRGRGVWREWVLRSVRA